MNTDPLPRGQTVTPPPSVVGVCAFYSPSLRIGVAMEVTKLIHCWNGNHEDGGSGHVEQEDCIDPWQYLPLYDPPGTTRLQLIRDRLHGR